MRRRCTRSCIGARCRCRAPPSRTMASCTVSSRGAGSPGCCCGKSTRARIPTAGSTACSAISTDAGWRARNWCCGRITCPATSCSSITPVRRCRSSIGTRARSGRRRSLSRYSAAPTSALPRPAGPRVLPTGSAATCARWCILAGSRAPLSRITSRAASTRRTATSPRSTRRTRTSPSTTRWRSCRRGSGSRATRSGHQTISCVAERAGISSGLRGRYRPPAPLTRTAPSSGANRQRWPLP